MGVVEFFILFYFFWRFYHFALWLFPYIHICHSYFKKDGVLSIHFWNICKQNGNGLFRKLKPLDEDFFAFVSSAILWSEQSSKKNCAHRDFLIITPVGCVHVITVWFQCRYQEAFAVYAGCNLILAAAAAALCAYVAPAAAGSGIPEVKAYLNGVDAYSILAPSTLFVKVIQTSNSCLTYFISCLTRFKFECNLIA